MTTYAIGDIQGCYTSLQKLLDHIQFNPTQDILWFTGDLVNRGPQSLETLRFIKSLGNRQYTVLGNHDLHLLAVAYDKQPTLSDDTLDAILTAPDRDELLEWLCQQSLLHHDETLGYVMVHAGLAPHWDLATAKALAHEVETQLRSKDRLVLLDHIYGNYPDNWGSQLTGYNRLRCIINYFTRLRFCYSDGRMELKSKGALEQNSSLFPWFNVPHRVNQDLKIIFGHWSALNGVTHTPNTFALDTGCVWGGSLTAMRLEDAKRFSV